MASVDPTRDAANQVLQRDPPLLIAHIDRDLRYRHVSASYAERFGMSARAFVGRAVREVLGAELYTRIEPRLLAAWRGEHVEYEIEVEYAGFGRRLMRTCYEPEPGPDGTVVGLIAVIQDVTDRRDAETTLLRHEERQDLAQRVASIGTFEYDAGGRVEWSPSLSALYGFEHGAFPGTYAAWRALVHPDDLAAIDGARLHDADHDETRTEFRIRRADTGEERWVASHARRLRDADGGIARTTGINLDITDRKRAEQRAADARAMLQIVADSAPALLSYVDAEGRYQLNNRAYETWFGHRIDEIQGRHMRDVLGEAAWERLKPRIDAALAGQVVSFEESVVYRDAGPRWISATYTPDIGADGRVRGFIVHVADVTERHEIESAVREHAETVETLNRVGATLASNLELGRVVELVTEEATRLSDAKFGAFFYNVLDERGESYMLFTLAGAARSDFERFGMPRNTAMFRPTFRGDGPVRIADVLVDPRYGKSAPHYGLPAGHLPVRSYLAVPVVSRSGKVLGGLFFGHPEPGVFGERHERLVVGLAAQAAIAIDNANLYENLRASEAEQRLLAARLREADQRKDVFLATLAHELRNPLAPIRNALSITARAKDEDSRSRALAIIDRQVGQMVRLIDDLLDLSRITTGRLELKRETVEVARLVAAAVETSEPLIVAQRHAFTQVLPTGNVHVHGDPVRLTHVLANLLNNAAKYTDAGGRIELAVRALPDAVEIAVRDTGVGIAPDALPHVFDMFYQVEGSLGRARGGLGIGLTLVRSLVELHDGSISVRSEGPGLGSEFAVRLPRVASPAASDGQATRGVARGAERIRVLVADDNLDAAESLGAVLELAGHEVRVVHDGDAALEAVEAFSPEVCVLDIGMPGRDGHSVAREVRARYGADGPALVALTGWGQKADQERAYEAGFDRHLTKPADADQIAGIVAELAGSAKRQRPPG